MTALPSQPKRREGLITLNLTVAEVSGRTGPRFIRGTCPRFSTRTKTLADRRPIRSVSEIRKSNYKDRSKIDRSSSKSRSAITSTWNNSALTMPEDSR